MNYQNIAVLITCFNRRDITLACLRALFSQALPQNTRLFVYLVDDGSSDGTGDAVANEYPQVKLLKGDGSLFWCGGMRLAWAEAMKGDYDYFLWLNDDTTLMTGAVHDLLSCAEMVRQKDNGPGIIVGSCLDPKTGEHTYGGALRKSGLRVIPNNEPQQCDMINGNIVLIPREVSSVVGNISPEFIHTSGDNDYGLRALSVGCKSWVCPNYQGFCSSNTQAAWSDPSISIFARLRYLHSPKGQPPYETYIFAKRHSGFFWPMDIVKLYLKVIFPDFYGKLKKFNNVSISKKEAK